MAEIVAATERLRLREWDDADETRFYEVMNTEPVMRHLGGVQTPEQWHLAYERIRACARDFGHCFWIVEGKTSGELLGFCGLKRVNSPGAGDLTGTPEIGWRLRETAWSKGIAKEAAIASLDLAFGRLGFVEVVAITVAANVESSGLMERLGMRRRKDLDYIDPRFGSDLNPSMIWRVGADEWPAARVGALRPANPRRAN